MGAAIEQDFPPYGDLVRIYIGRVEPDSKKTLDLYQAFDAIVRDEEGFRDQLRQYAELVDGHPQITPRDIPSIVSQHLPWLMAAAKNKMFNAELVLRRSPGSLAFPYGYPTDASAKEQRDLKPPHRKLWGEPTDRKHRPAAQFLAGLPSDYGDEVLARLKRRRTAAIVVYPMAPDPSALASSPERQEIVLALAWLMPIDLA